TSCLLFVGFALLAAIEQVTGARKLKKPTHEESLDFPLRPGDGIVSRRATARDGVFGPDCVDLCREGIGGALCNCAQLPPAWNDEVN
ncbi:Hypothetical predicted protein, partial [Paramuricea clavata]